MDSRETNFETNASDSDNWAGRWGWFYENADEKRAGVVSYAEAFLFVLLGNQTSEWFGYLEDEMSGLYLRCHNKPEKEPATQKRGKMAKAGMRRPDPKDPHGTESNHKTKMPKNDGNPVPEIQGRAKSGKEKANPM